MIATGLASDRHASPELAKAAVAEAMTKANINIANSVLLFLTPEFARDPQPALLAASRAANCTQIIGCSAFGIFTEREWMLDKPSAAAMVFGGDISLVTAAQPQANDLLLSLAAPNAINTTWMHEPGIRFGGVSGDATGQGPFKVWGNSKVATSGRFESYIQGAQGKIGLSQGVRALSAPLEITKVSGYDVISLTSQPALNVLARELPIEVRELDRIPLHLIMAGITFGDPINAISEGRFRLMPIISTNDEDRSVTLSARLPEGERLFWALRQPLAAEHDMRLTIERLQKNSSGTPDFALIFSCTGRGPYFYGGIDRDLELFKKTFPNTPLVGFYGNGEIAPLNGENNLFQYSAVIGLFKKDV
jgi:small ligand-binding sensory domain FIST